MFDSSTRILIVDNMLTMRKILAGVCKELGFTDVVEAEDSPAAWQIIQDSKPAIGLVFSDWKMPNGSGLDLAKRIRADARFQNIPFVLVSAEAEAQHVVEALRAGVDSFIVKPFTSAILKEKLDAVSLKRKGTSST